MTAYPKPRRIKSESYRRYVASQECFGCRIEGWSQCCHPNGAGMGTKADDSASFPLCSVRPGNVGCHYRLDHCIGITLDERKEREQAYTARMQARARAAGRPEIA